MNKYLENISRGGAGAPPPSVKTPYLGNKPQGIIPGSKIEHVVDSATIQKTQSEKLKALLIDGSLDSIKNYAREGRYNFKFENGDSPLHIVMDNSKDESVKLDTIKFLSQYINLNEANNLGETIAHIAAKEQYEKIFEFLHSKGFNFEVSDINGKTPLMLYLSGKPVECKNTNAKLNPLVPDNSTDENNEIDNDITEIVLEVLNGNTVNYLLESLTKSLNDLKGYFPDEFEELNKVIQKEIITILKNTNLTTFETEKMLKETILSKKTLVAAKIKSLTSSLIEDVKISADKNPDRWGPTGSATKYMDVKIIKELTNYQLKNMLEKKKIFKIFDDAIDKIYDGMHEVNLSILRIILQIGSIELPAIGVYPQRDSIFGIKDDGGLISVNNLDILGLYPNNDPRTPDDPNKNKVWTDILKNVTAEKLNELQDSIVSVNNSFVSPDRDSLFKNIRSNVLDEVTGNGIVTLQKIFNILGFEFINTIGGIINPPTVISENLTNFLSHVYDVSVSQKKTIGTSYRTISYVGATANVYSFFKEIYNNMLIINNDKDKISHTQYHTLIITLGNIFKIMDTYLEIISFIRTNNIQKNIRRRNDDPRVVEDINIKINDFEQKISTAIINILKNCIILINNVIIPYINLFNDIYSINFIQQHFINITTTPLNIDSVFTKKLHNIKPITIEQLLSENRIFDIRELIFNTLTIPPYDPNFTYHKTTEPNSIPTVGSQPFILYTYTHFPVNYNTYAKINANYTMSLNSSNHYNIVNTHFVVAKTDKIQDIGYTDKYLYYLKIKLIQNILTKIYTNVGALPVPVPITALKTKLTNTFSTDIQNESLISMIGEKANVLIKNYISYLIDQYSLYTVMQSLNIAYDNFAGNYITVLPNPLIESRSYILKLNSHKTLDPIKLFEKSIADITKPGLQYSIKLDEDIEEQKDIVEVYDSEGVRSCIKYKEKIIDYLKKDSQKKDVNGQMAIFYSGNNNLKKILDPNHFYDVYAVNISGKSFIDVVLGKFKMIDSLKSFTEDDTKKMCNIMKDMADKRMPKYFASILTRALYMLNHRWHKEMCFYVNGVKLNDIQDMVVVMKKYYIDPLKPNKYDDRDVFPKSFLELSTEQKKKIVQEHSEFSIFKMDDTGKIKDKIDALEKQLLKVDAEIAISATPALNALKTKITDEKKELTEIKISVPNKAIKNTALGTAIINMDNAINAQITTLGGPRNATNKSLEDQYEDIKTIAGTEKQQYYALWNEYINNDNLYIDVLQPNLNKVLKGIVDKAKEALKNKNKANLDTLKKDCIIIRDMYEKTIISFYEDKKNMEPILAKNYSLKCVFDIVKSIMEQLCFNLHSTIARALYNFVSQSHSENKTIGAPREAFIPEIVSRIVDRILAFQINGKTLREFIVEKYPEELTKNLMKLYKEGHDPSSKITPDILNDKIVTYIVSNNVLTIDKENEVVKGIEAHVFPYYKKVFSNAYEYLAEILSKYEGFVRNEFYNLETLIILLEYVHAKI